MLQTEELHRLGRCVVFPLPVIHRVVHLPVLRFLKVPTADDYPGAVTPPESPPYRPPMVPPERLHQTLHEQGLTIKALEAMVKSVHRDMMVLQLDQCNHEQTVRRRMEMATNDVKTLRNDLERQTKSLQQEVDQLQTRLQRSRSRGRRA